MNSIINLNHATDRESTGIKLCATDSSLGADMRHFWRHGERFCRAGMHDAGIAD